MSRILRLAAVGLLASLSACGKSPPAEERDALVGLSFSVPFTVRVSLSQPTDALGNLQESDDTRLIALFAKARLASSAPSTTGAPWWHFVGAAPYFNSGSLFVPAASRAIMSRTEQRFWTEGSIDYFAETITYSLRPTEILQGAAKGMDLTGTLRLVLQKDPAVGHWQVYSDSVRGTKWSQSDSDALTQALVWAGTQYASDLHDKIQAARKAAFDQIEQSLASSGTMERLPGEPGIRFSRNSNLHYLPMSRYRTGMLTVGQLRAVCAGQRFAKLPWHLAHNNELQALFSRGNFFNQSSVVDTPDHRLWPEFATITAPGLIVISDTPDANQPRAALAYKIEALGAQFIPQFQLVPLWLDGADFNTAPITDGYGGQFPILAICVSNGQPERAPVSISQPLSQRENVPTRKFNGQSVTRNASGDWDVVNHQ